MDHLIAVSTDGKRFVLFNDGTWKAESPTRQKTAAFRSATWGASIDEVKISESSELVHETADFLAFKTTVANFEALALYTFVANKLVSGRYSFQEPHANNQVYLHDYWTLRDLMKQKYGSPNDTHAFWNNDLYRDSVDEWGMAVACGHVSFFEIWDIDDTHIEVQLYGDNFEVNLEIMYQSISLKGLLEDKNKKSALSAL